jgi:S-adenosylmethionine:tRNA ribosyltransferase-isomerase
MPKLSDFDYNLPERLIAQYPTDRRGQSRLMVIDRATGEIRLGVFEDLTTHIQQGDTLVLNDTRVFPCRLKAHKPTTGANIEILLLRELEDGLWEALVRPGKRVKVGTRLSIAGQQEPDTVEVVANHGMIKKLRFHGDDVRDLCWRIGKMPLPPYIKREAEHEDRDRYQTVFARNEGAVAAPTAGLHFSDRMLEKLRNKGVALEYVTLHVGLGTFQPLEHEDVEKNTLHAERYHLTRETARRLNEIRRTGHRICAVGTTTLRLLETTVSQEGEFMPGEGVSDIFLYPGHEFHSADALLTNFHLPRSSLLLLVCAFAGRDLIMRAYETALKEEFRFYSYGDAMLIL